MTRGCASESGGTVAVLYAVCQRRMWVAFRRRGSEDADCRCCVALGVQHLVRGDWRVYSWPTCSRIVWRILCHAVPSMPEGGYGFGASPCQGH